MVPLRIPDVSHDANPHHVVENLRRFHQLPCIHISSVPRPEAHGDQPQAGQGPSEFEVTKPAGHPNFSTTRRFYLRVRGDVIDRARKARATNRDLA
jgi:hypothetical protein